MAGVAASPLSNAKVNRVNAAKQHKVLIQVQCDSQLQVYTDLYKLQQVLVNCIDNGAAFSSTIENGQMFCCK